MRLAPSRQMNFPTRMEPKMNRPTSTFTLIRLAATALALAFISAASAGEFFEKDGVAQRGYDPVAYFNDGRPVKGTAEYRAEYKGSTFHFASQAARDAFVADPARYAP